MGLVLASMIVSCSDEDNTIVPDTNPDPVIPVLGFFLEYIMSTTNARNY